MTARIENGYTRAINNATISPCLLACLDNDIPFLRWHLKAGNLPFPQELEKCLRTCIILGLENIISLLLSAVSLKKEYIGVIQKLLSRMCVIRDDDMTILFFKSGFVPTNPNLLGSAFHNGNWVMFENLLSSGISTEGIRTKLVKNEYPEYHTREALRRMFYVYTGIYDALFNMLLGYVGL